MFLVPGSDSIAAAYFVYLFVFNCVRAMFLAFRPSLISKINSLYDIGFRTAISHGQLKVNLCSYAHLSIRVSMIQYLIVLQWLFNLCPGVPLDSV